MSIEKRWMYLNPETGNLSIATASSNCPIPFEEICRKDTPPGVPYIIIPDDYEFPQYMLDFWGAMEVDFSNPDGYGIGTDAWFAENGG